MQNLLNLINPAIVDQAKALDQLTRVVKSVLPRNFWSHISVVGIQNQELVLIASSPVWATRIRLHSADMLTMLQQHADTAITGLRIRLSKSTSMSPTAMNHKQKPRFLSPSAAKLIRQTADSIDNIQLKQALLKLSNKTKPDFQIR